MGNELHLVLELLFHLQKVLITQVQWLSYCLVADRLYSLEEYRSLTRHLYRSPKVTPRKRRVIPPRMPRNEIINGIDIYDRTGIERSAFMKIFCSIRGDLEKPRSGTRKVRVTLSSQHRLLMVLQWMREYPKMKVLGQLYGVSRLFAKREIRHLIPILFVRMNYIGWPGEFEPSPCNFQAVIDCSAHTRLRIHPGSTEYYRGDKKRHIMVSQVVCGLQGAVFDVTIGKGHNNDQAMFILSGMKFHTELNQLNLLADRGYHHHRITTPASPEWTKFSSHHRVIVENVIGQAKQFAVASAVFRQSPELQALVLVVCFELVAEKNQHNELRYFPL
jgi:hypothetical protein